MRRGFQRHRQIEAGEPSLRMSAGAKLMVMWVRGMSYHNFSSGSHTVAAFPNRRRRQTLRCGNDLIGLDPGNIDFDLDDVGIDAIDCGAKVL